MIQKLIILFIVVFDQLIKFLIRKNFYLLESKPITSFVSLTYIQNPGGSFGFLHNFKYSNLLFIVFSVVIIIFIFVYEKKLIQLGGRFSGYSIVLIYGGAFGNLIDRIFLGSVTDFIDFHFFPVFNVADSCISVGSVILFLSLYLKRQ